MISIKRSSVSNLDITSRREDELFVNPPSTTCIWLILYTGVGVVQNGIYVEAITVFDIPL